MEVFGIADYQSTLEVNKLKMVDPIWRTKMQKIFDLDETRYLMAFEVTDDYVSKIFKINFLSNFFATL